MDAQNTYINTNKPRESIVVAAGDNVKKMPTTTRPEYIRDWLKKQRHANIIVNFILKYENRHGGYFIPQVIQINNSVDAPYVIEQRAPGVALTQKLFDTLSPDTKEKVYTSLANFVYDINHCRPMLTFEQKLNEPGKSGLDFVGVVNKLSAYLDAPDIAAINNAYNFFCSRPDMLSGVVLFHGDMNENNIFYDEKTDTVSFIDFAESNYETIDYIFNNDLKKLPWLDTQKLAGQYQKMIAPENINVKSNPGMLDLYNKLLNLKWAGENMITNKNPALFKKIVQEQISALTKSYGNVVASLAQQQSKIL